MLLIQEAPSIVSPWQLWLVRQVMHDIESKVHMIYTATMQAKLGRSLNLSKTRRTRPVITNSINVLHSKTRGKDNSRVHCTVSRGDYCSAPIIARKAMVWRTRV